MRDTVGAAPTPYWQMMLWVADWIRRGGRMLGKATKYEEREGKF
jgi:hypothetical protein